ncbi:DUF1214 domain-containing protein [Candidatus Synechococcus calcipolaris G9]|uniref:DUF1214 domain-containing protein n=1 Tax=Candidatus Synechococcus calcipolaris G9 TaxID=1497997 RepID=A0ABT6EYL0_9SYNE|nr:DUF1214 domain-containing protein [Candidatus Synechococcus calcipolaris]MDG2990827.1 DUF1214 domain-containing protein [Candidatus Synechococcus calcipolaris G9]
MKRPLLLFFLAILGMILPNPVLSSASEKVTVDTYVRAETDTTLSAYVKQGAFGKFLHIRQPTPIDQQKVIRMNRDTIYSIGVFDLTEPVTIVMPDSKGRFQSMQVINQDHYTLAVYYGDGKTTFTFTKEDTGTRYLCILIRTFVDASDPADIRVANEIQDKIEVRQKTPGVFEVPDWNKDSLAKVRDAINILAGTRPTAKGMFGNKNEIDPISHLLGTAYGWGGNPDIDAVYVNVVPEKNDGKTPYVLTVSEAIPVDGFASITVYNAKGFMEKNDLDAYSVNNVTAKRNPDGSVTVHFGGDPDQPNYLPITPGWSYIVRMYQPKREVIDGSWEFPAAVPVQ